MRQTKRSGPPRGVHVMALNGKPPPFIKQPQKVPPPPHPRRPPAGSPQQHIPNNNNNNPTAAVSISPDIQETIRRLAIALQRDQDPYWNDTNVKKFTDFLDDYFTNKYHQGRYNDFCEDLLTPERNVEEVLQAVRDRLGFEFWLALQKTVGEGDADTDTALNSLYMTIAKKMDILQVTHAVYSLVRTEDKLREQLAFGIDDAINKTAINSQVLECVEKNKKQRHNKKVELAIAFGFSPSPSAKLIPDDVVESDSGTLEFFKSRICSFMPRFGQFDVYCVDKHDIKFTILVPSGLIKEGDCNAVRHKQWSASLPVDGKFFKAAVSAAEEEEEFEVVVIDDDDDGDKHTTDQQQQQQQQPTLPALPAESPPMITPLQQPFAAVFSFNNTDTENDRFLSDFSTSMKSAFDAYAEDKQKHLIKQINELSAENQALKKECEEKNKALEEAVGNENNLKVKLEEVEGRVERRNKSLNEANKKLEAVCAERDTLKESTVSLRRR